MPPLLLPLHDAARDRALPTTVYLPDAGDRAPLVLFAHGYCGHPRKFTRLLGRWAEAGYAVAAPAFPRTNDEGPPPYLMEDVVEQPADLALVLDELLARGIGDPERVGVAGFSLGAETALAFALHPRHGDARVRAVAAVAGRLHHGDLAADELRPLPVLLVHGTEDELVPYDGSVRVLETAPGPKELVPFEGAGHAICEDTDGEHADRVAELTTAFWNSYLRDDLPGG